MYKSKLEISNKNRKILEFKLNEFLMFNKKIHCKALRRKISLFKLPQAITKRRSSATKRLQCFFVAVDILKNEKEHLVREAGGCLEYEIKGLDRSGKVVRAHLREELIAKKDKILFFVSCF